MANAPSPEGFSLFVSCVEGQPVTRFGSRALIGADRTEDGVVYRPNEIVAIPAADHARYLKEYSRQIADGALRVRKAEEWVDQQLLSALEDEERVAAKAHPPALPEPEPASETTDAPKE